MQDRKSEKFVLKSSFSLEYGELAELTVQYTTYGTLNSAKDNVIWVCHAFSGNSDPLHWWGGLFGENKLYDPNEYFIICGSILGSCYGSTGALSINPLTNELYYHTFPLITVRDVVRSLDLVRNHLGIRSIHTCIGGSLGGQQALEWAVMNPDLIENLILLCTNAQHSPWGIAFNESQRMAIRADSTWNENSAEAGKEGLKVARAIAMMSYRSYETFARTQPRHQDLSQPFRACTYQEYQGQKLSNRFDAFAYWSLSKTMDSHDLGRNRGTIETVLQSILSKTLVIGVDSDYLFPISEQKFLSEFIPNSELKIIESIYGHDGFLVENDKIKTIIEEFYELCPSGTSEVERLGTT